jgi:hypothetical protein
MPFPAVPTPIQCPFCRAQITVPIRQIVDVTEEPRLKSVLLAGQLNAFVCPSCRNRAALAMPFLYHDANKDLAFVFLPMEMGLKDADQQRIIGQLTKAVLNKLPEEKRKAYLLMPKQFFTMQGLLDAILEADGITKEMLAAQEAKLQLLQQMLETTDPEAQRKLIQEHDADVDSTFFQMLSAALLSAQSERSEQDFQMLMAFRNNLMELTTVGKRVKAQQAAVEAFQAKPDRETLLAQLVNAPDAETREILLTFGRPLLDYPFFQALTTRIEAANAAGNQAEAEHIIELRREILSTREKLDAAAKAALDERADLLRELVTAENLDQAVRDHLEDLDETFLGLLDANLQAAKQANQKATFDRLQAVAEAISRAIAATQPPEVRFVNTLLSVQYPDETRKVLDANRKALSPQLIAWMQGVAEDLKQNGRADAAEQLGKVIEQARELVPSPVAGVTASAPAAPPPPAEPKPQILIAKR